MKSGPAPVGDEASQTLYPTAAVLRRISPKETVMSTPDLCEPLPVEYVGDRALFLGNFPVIFRDASVPDQQCLTLIRVDTS